MGEFEDILARRAVPDMPPGMEERIINMARTREAAIRAPGRTWWRAFLDEFALPQPALAMAVMIMAGALVGFYSGNLSTGQDEELVQFYTASNFSMEDGL